MSKHSEGPWRSGRQDMVSYYMDSNGPWKNVYRPAREGDRLHLGDVLLVEVAKAFGDTEDEVLANARLIASAPSMVALLREVVTEGYLAELIDNRAIAGLRADEENRCLTEIRALLKEVDGVP